MTVLVHVPPPADREGDEDPRDGWHSGRPSLRRAAAGVGTVSCDRLPGSRASPSARRARTAELNDGRRRADAAPADGAGAHMSSCRSSPGRAAHEVGDALLRRAPALEHLVHVLGDRHVDAEAPRRGRAARRWWACPRRPGRPAARPAPAGPRPSSSPASRLRLWRDVQVAMRSPIPARPVKVSTRAPRIMPEPRHLGDAARDEAGARVVAEAQAVGDADRDGDRVLGGAAELDPRRRRRSCTRGRCRWSRPPAAPAPSPRRRRRSTVADGMSRETSSAWLGPESAAAPAPVSSAITSVGRLSVPSSKPLASDSCSAPSARRGATQRATSRIACVGTA